jgi:hypothetical protein
MILRPQGRLCRRSADHGDRFHAAWEQVAVVLEEDQRLFRRRCETMALAE